MDINNLLNSLIGIDVWGVFKIFALAGLLVYVVFAVVVVRQVKLMTDVITGMLSGFLRLISWLFLLVAILVFIFAVLFL